MQALMCSSRLPSKVLLLVVAMSVELTDDAIAALCAREGATCMRGLERRAPPKSIAVRGAR